MGAKQTTFYPNTKIEGYNSSTAQKFCYENPKKFISIGDAPEIFRIENYYRFNRISNALLNLKSETDVESDNVSIFDAIRSKREMIYENLAYNIHWYYEIKSSEPRTHVVHFVITVWLTRE